MARQLVLCIDGTNNRFSDEPTNVLRIFRTLPKNSETVLTYYDQGVGTFGLSETLFEWQKLPSRIAGLAFGWGIKRNVLNAYRFLMEHYKPDDQIFIYGFLRVPMRLESWPPWSTPLGYFPPIRRNNWISPGHC